MVVFFKDAKQKDITLTLESESKTIKIIWTSAWSVCRYARDARQISLWCPLYLCIHTKYPNTIDKVQKKCKNTKTQLQIQNQSKCPMQNIKIETSWDGRLRPWWNSIGRWSSSNPALEEIVSLLLKDSQ